MSVQSTAGRKLLQFPMPMPGGGQFPRPGQPGQPQVIFATTSLQPFHAIRVFGDCTRNTSSTSGFQLCNAHSMIIIIRRVYTVLRQSLKYPSCHTTPHAWICLSLHRSGIVDEKCCLSVPVWRPTTLHAEPMTLQLTC